MPFIFDIWEPHIDLTKKGQRSFGVTRGQTEYLDNIDVEEPNCLVVLLAQEIFIHLKSMIYVTLCIEIIVNPKLLGNFQELRFLWKNIHCFVAHNN